MDSDFRVGNWVVRPERLCIHRPGETVHLTPKCMAVLQVLARAGGAVVARNEILDTVWPGAAVTDDVLTHCIVELRKAFDDSAQEPKVIQTIAKRGFRLIAEVAPVDQKPATRWSASQAAAATIILVLVVAMAVWLAGRPNARPSTFDGTANVEAYEALLSGDDAYLGAQPDAMRALKYYERAIELDPEFALAWSRIAEASHVATWNWGEGEPFMLLEQRDRAIATALRLAPDSPDVVASSAKILVFRSKFREARVVLDELRRRHGSQNIRAAFVSLDLSLQMGRLDDAYREIRFILERDPRNRRLPVFLSHYYLLSERPADALAVLEPLVAGDADSAAHLYGAAQMALATGRREEVEKWLRRFVEEMPDEWLDIDLFEHAMLERLDDRDAALQYLGDLQSRSSRWDYRIPVWASYFGDDAMALKSMKRTPIPWIMWNPLLKRIRETGDFRQIVIDVGLVDYWREFGWGDFCKPTKGDDFECH